MLCIHSGLTLGASCFVFYSQNEICFRVNLPNYFILSVSGSGRRAVVFEYVEENCLILRLALLGSDGFSVSVGQAAYCF